MWLPNAAAISADSSFTVSLEEKALWGALVMSKSWLNGHLKSSCQTSRYTLVVFYAISSEITSLANTLIQIILALLPVLYIMHSMGTARNALQQTSFGQRWFMIWCRSAWTPTGLPLQHDWGGGVDALGGLAVPPVVTIVVHKNTYDLYHLQHEVSAWFHHAIWYHDIMMIWISRFIVRRHFFHVVESWNCEGVLP